MATLHSAPEPSPGGVLARVARSSLAANYALLSPMVIVLVLTLALPIALLILYSFWSEDGLVLNKELTSAQYERALGSPAYRGLFLRSVGISGLVTLVTVAMAYPMAYFVAFHVRRNKFLW